MTVYGATTDCPERRDVAIWYSPRTPTPDQPLKIMAVADLATADELVISDPEDKPLSLHITQRGGPPWSLSTIIDQPRTGNYRLELLRDGKVVACRSVEIGSTTRAPATDPPWDWDLGTEALFSAWIEQLFDAPPEENLNFPSIAPVLRNPERNFLHNYLGLNEDNILAATPDCADLPYYLRAYFAWKIGLPMGFRSCSRGSGNAPPRCAGPTVTGQIPQSLTAFKGYTSQLMNGVHSGNGRTALADDATDFYPVPLKRDFLRPGTLYADPYGHTLIVVKWIPQTRQHGGLLLAADAQPDNSVSRKRFWEGTFLYSDSVASAGPGFKYFRPLQRTEAGSLHTLANDELADNLNFSPFSTEQATLSQEAFYTRMGKLINPDGLDPNKAYEETLNALVEQLETRVASVDNGEQYFRSHRGVIPMPDGAQIFETTGPWEDYATPSRDLRLLIAMNVLTGLPERIISHPELFLLGKRSAEMASAEIKQLHQRLIEERSITYTRSDGSPQRLTVAQLLARKPDLEMAYNPNDCVEIRWGAEAGSEENASCKRHAPPAQRARMEQVRGWFREARRPSR